MAEADLSSAGHCPGDSPEQGREGVSTADASADEKEKATGEFINM